MIHRTPEGRLPRSVTVATTLLAGVLATGATAAVAYKGVEALRHNYRSNAEATLTPDATRQIDAKAKQVAEKTLKDAASAKDAMIDITDGSGAFGISKLKSLRGVDVYKKTHTDGSTDITEWAFGTVAGAPNTLVVQYGDRIQPDGKTGHDTWVNSQISFTGNKAVPKKLTVAAAEAYIKDPGTHFTELRESLPARDYVTSVTGNELYVDWDGPGLSGNEQDGLSGPELRDDPSSQRAEDFITYQLSKFTTHQTE